ncbi:MAG: hypothetical protein DRP30_04540, partial [Thermotoga sp.]
MKNKLIAGLFSLALILLVAIGPLWSAEKLEEVETSRSGLIPFTQVIEQHNNTTITTYSPFWESNEDNKGYIYWSNEPLAGIGYCVRQDTGSNTAINIPGTFNVSGYEDVYNYGLVDGGYVNSGLMYIHLYYTLDFDYLNTHNINTFYLMVDMEDYDYSPLRFIVRN